MHLTVGNRRATKIYILLSDKRSYSCIHRYSQRYRYRYRYRRY